MLLQKGSGELDLHEELQKVRSFGLLLRQCRRQCGVQVRSELAGAGEALAREKSLNRSLATKLTSLGVAI